MTLFDPVLLVVPVLAAVVWGQSYRYDVLTVRQREVPYPDYTMLTMNACDCRKRCIPDNSCLAYSVLPTNKTNWSLCLFSTAEGVQYRLLVNKASVTYFKERKPKHYFWTQTVSNHYPQPEAFDSMCTAENGFPGIILTKQDYDYIDLKLNSLINGTEAWQIPLFDWVWHNTTLRIEQVELKLLFTNYVDKLFKRCHYLKRATPIQLVRDQGFYSNKSILCYKYDF